jgi:drug/metabolite transporter (DMT)-like permease
MTRSSNLSRLILLLVLSTLWAGTFVFVKIADEQLDPFTIMAARALISAVFLFITLPLCGRTLSKNFTNLRYQLVCLTSAILIGYMWLTIGYSEQVLSAAMASLLLTALVPITWLIAVLFLREKPFYSVNCFGIIVATFGMLVIIGFQNILHADHELYASLLYISGIALFAVAATANKRFAPDIDPLITIAFNLFYIGVILTVAACLHGDPAHDHFTFKNIAALLALGIGSTGVGYLIYFYLSHHAGMVYAAISSYIVPIIGYTMGVMFLDEPLHWQKVIGLLIVIIGMWFIQRKKKFN